jgi:hypothetical protein
MKNRQFIRLYHRTKNSPLSLTERLVQAVLVRQLDWAEAASGTFFGATVGRIRSITGFAQKTVLSALHSLQGMQLAKQKDGKWIATEPPPEAEDWFHYHAGSKWWLGISYTAVYLPVSPLTLPQSCLLATLILL